MSKLHCLGIRGPILQWIKYFLSGTRIKDYRGDGTSTGGLGRGSLSSGRTMRACIQGHMSHSRDVLSGMPQGSVLGPLLFLVYINSVDSALCQYKIFADDLKIYTCVKRNRLSEMSVITYQCVQDDINTLHDTALSWGFHMNVSKCAVLRFCGRRDDTATSLYFLNGREIPNLNSTKDVGVMVDIDLKFHTHIRTICHKAGGLAQSLLKSTVSRSPEFMLFFT